MMTYTMYTAVIIQVYTCNDRARLQNGSRSLDKVDATRLLHSQRHHHLHHLTRQHEQTVNKKKKNTERKSVPSEISFQNIHLNLCIRLSCTDVIAVLDYVLQQFASRGRPQHRGIRLLLKHTRLVANGYAVAVGMKSFRRNW